MSDWIKWNGGERPVEDGVWIDIEFRNSNRSITDTASTLRWDKRITNGDIIAYRISEKEEQDFGQQNKERPMHEKYPAYYKDVSHLTSIDVYRVHRLFEVNDPVIHHASKKLLMAGSRTGEKFEFDDIREARDSLNRWLDMAEEDKEGEV